MFRLSALELFLSCKQSISIKPINRCSSYLLTMSTNREALAAGLLNRLNETERNIRFLMIEVKKIRRDYKELIESDCTDTAETSKPKLEVDVNQENIPIKRSKYSFTEENRFTVVFTDGACPNNGKSQAKAGIGVWWGHEHPLNVSKPTIKRHTNNAAEIQACVEACRIANEYGIERLLIRTDSNFVIKCMTEWIHKWKKNSWKTATGKDVINKDELLELDGQAKLLKEVKYEYTKAHCGIEGNEQADKLAVQGALMNKF